MCTVIYMWFIWLCICYPSFFVYIVINGVWLILLVIECDVHGYSYVMCNSIHMLYVRCLYVVCDVICKLFIWLFMCYPSFYIWLVMERDVYGYLYVVCDVFCKLFIWLFMCYPFFYIWLVMERGLYGYPYVICDVIYKSFVWLFIRCLSLYIWSVVECNVYGWWYIICGVIYKLFVWLFNVIYLFIYG